MDDSGPVEDVARVGDAQRRFVSAITSVQFDPTAPCALPGWTIGHLLAHVARNADSHVRRAEAAERGEVVEQYTGGYAGRAAEIEAGASASVAEMVDDVRRSGDELAEVWERLSRSAWAMTTHDVGGRSRPLRSLPGRRWQELEVHLVDVQLGVTYRDWSDDFVAAWLPHLRTSLASRLPTGARPPGSDDFGDTRDELAWLYGRLRRDDLPTLVGWG